MRQTQRSGSRVVVPQPRLLLLSLLLTPAALLLLLHAHAHAHSDVSPPAAAAAYDVCVQRAATTALEARGASLRCKYCGKDFHALEYAVAHVGARHTFELARDAPGCPLPPQPQPQPQAHAHAQQQAAHPASGRLPSLAELAALRARAAAAAATPSSADAPAPPLVRAATPRWLADEREHGWAAVTESRWAQHRPAGEGGGGSGDDAAHATTPVVVKRLAFNEIVQLAPAPQPATAHESAGVLALRHRLDVQRGALRWPDTVMHVLRTLALVPAGGVVVQFPGGYGELAASVARDVLLGRGMLVAFEPQRAVAQCLGASAQLNALRNVFIVSALLGDASHERDTGAEIVRYVRAQPDPAAASAAAGTCSVCLERDTLMPAGFEPPPAGSGDAGAPLAYDALRTQSLDWLALPHVDLVLLAACDEADAALRGAAQTIKQHRPFVLLACPAAAALPDAVARYMQPDGTVLWGATPYRVARVATTPDARYGVWVAEPLAGTAGSAQRTPPPPFAVLAGSGSGAGARG